MARYRWRATGPSTTSIGCPRSWAGRRRQRPVTRTVTRAPSDTSLDRLYPE